MCSENSKKPRTSPVQNERIIKSGDNRDPTFFSGSESGWVETLQPKKMGNKWIFKSPVAFVTPKEEYNTKLSKKNRVW